MKNKSKAAQVTKPQVKVQDLKAKKDAKGGKPPGFETNNHNETFVCDGRR
jgi:hypothetical protein